MRKLALANCWIEFGIFEVVLSDWPIGNDFTPFTSSHITPCFIISLLPVFVAEHAQAAKLEKKKTITVASAQKLGHLTKKNKKTAKREKIPTSFSVPIELIRPSSKWRVRVTSIATETMSLRYMRGVDVDDGL